MTTCSCLGSAEREALCAHPSQPLGTGIPARYRDGSRVPLAVSLVGPAMPAPWPPHERGASPSAFPLLLEPRPSPSAPSSVQCLSLFKGRSCLQVAQTTSGVGNRQELWGIGTAQRQGVTETQRPNTTPCHCCTGCSSLQLPHRDGEDSGNKGSCTPKLF